MGRHQRAQNPRENWHPTGQEAAPRQMATRWCFTINNFTPAELFQIEQHIEAIEAGTSEHLDALIFEKEHDEYSDEEEEEEEGHDQEWTPHLQGFFRLKAQKQLTWVKRHLAGFTRAHLEVARGTDEQNIRYCSKEGRAKMAGTFRNVHTETKKKVWDDIRDLIKEGATPEQIRDEYPAQYLSRQAGITQWICEIYADANPDPWDGDLKTKNIWVWGPAGTGKSRWAHQLQGRKYMKNTNKWWDGFARHDIVIIEDLDPQRCTALVQHLKIWADRYPFNGEVKGGTRPIHPDYKLVITSNYHPRDCFSNPEDLQAITRRFTICEMAIQGAVPEWGT